MSGKINKYKIKELLEHSKHNNLLQRIFIYILSFIYFFRCDEKAYNKQIHKLYNELENINLVLIKS